MAVKFLDFHSVIIEILNVDLTAFEVLPGTNKCFKGGGAPDIVEVRQTFLVARSEAGKIALQVGQNIHLTASLITRSWHLIVHDQIQLSGEKVTF